VSEQDDTGADAGTSADAEPTVDRDGGNEHAPTGVPAADAARERLAAVDDAPVDQHVDVYEDVHRRLQEGLADLDER
jgi:hypothetical protein